MEDAVKRRHRRPDIVEKCGDLLERPDVSREHANIGQQ